jgi:hypothetical protein
VLGGLEKTGLDLLEPSLNFGQQGSIGDTAKLLG